MVRSSSRNRAAGCPLGSAIVAILVGFSRPNSSGSSCALMFGIGAVARLSQRWVGAALYHLPAVLAIPIA